MGTRLEFQSILEDLNVGATVYFQPPDNVNMNYPSIVYNRDFQQDLHADNIRYAFKVRYQLTVIDRDPDSSIPDQVSALPLSKFVRHYTTAGLNHDIYYVYF